jgi:putative ABC transport system substrate-binding protein
VSPALALCGALLSLVFVASAASGADAGKVPRIGYLGTHTAWTGYFRDALAELDYSEGRNVEVEWRVVDHDFARLPRLAAELVSLHADVIFVDSTPAALAAKQTTRAVPIVFTEVGDPVGAGIVASLPKPGGNITGMTIMTPDITAKRLELLRETVPRSSRVAILLNPTHPLHKVQLSQAEAAALRLGLKIQPVLVSSEAEIEAAFARIGSVRTTTLLITDDTLFWNLHARLATLAKGHGLPTMGGIGAFAEAGGLMVYGPSLKEQFRRAATYVDRILKGAKPADLPVEQPTNFELVVNLKTARALGITIPKKVLFRADQVIE